MAPLEPQEKGFALADWHLKSCAACGLHSRWQLCCLTDVAYPLRVIRCLPGVVSKRLGLLLSSLSLCLRFGSLTQFPPTLDLYRFAIACRGGFAGARRVDCTIGRKWFDYAPAVRTTENACTVDRRKLGCTSARSAERQRMLGAEANRLAKPMAASAAMPPRRHFHSAGAALLQAPSCRCEPFSWGSKGDILFREREYPPYSAPLHGAGEKRCSPCGLQILYSTCGSFAAGFISNAQMTIARIVFGSMYVPLYSTE